MVLSPKCRLYQSCGVDCFDPATGLSKMRLIADTGQVNHKSINELIVSAHVALQPSKSIILLIIAAPIINLIAYALTQGRPGFLLAAIDARTHAIMQLTSETP
jgi:hypothetical protein